MQFQLYTIVLLFCSMSVLSKYFSRLLIDFSSDCICQSCTFSSGCWTSWNYSKYLINIILLNMQIDSITCYCRANKSASLTAKSEAHIATDLTKKPFLGPTTIHYTRSAFDISFAFYRNRNFCQFDTFRRYHFPNTSSALRHLLCFPSQLDYLPTQYF